MKDLYHTIYLYKNEYGEISDANNKINPSQSPVIEFSRSYVDYEKKIIKRGRIWLSSEWSKKNSVILKDYKELLIPEKYIYASLKNIIGGIFGSVIGLVLLCIYEDILYIYQAKIDNSYGEQLAKIYIPGISLSGFI